MVQYLTAIATDPATVSSLLSDGPDLRQFAVSGVLWLFVFWILHRLIKAFFQTTLGHKIVQNLSSEQRESFDLWVIELIVSTGSLIVFIATSSNIFVYGTFNASYLNDSPDIDWDRELSWMTEARSVTTCWGYSMQPLLFFYLYEVIAVSPMRALRSQHHLIVGHHLMCVLLLSYGFKATSSTLNARWAQMGYSCFLHMVCEQQTWVALIMYRLKLPGYGIFALVATGMEVLWRLFLWGWCFYVYAELTIFPCTITMWEVIWRVAFPFTALFLILAQCMTIRIHMLMAIKAFRESRRTTAPAARVVSEPTTAAIDRGKG